MTSQNIVIGGLAGAMPPLLGWAAISNTIEPNAPLACFNNYGLDPPHISGALAVHRVEDYADAEVPYVASAKRSSFYEGSTYCSIPSLLLATTLLPYAVPDVWRNLSHFSINSGWYILSLFI